MDRKKRLLIADSHTMIAEGLKEILQPEFEVAGVVADGRSLVEAALRLKPDGIVLEVSLPQLNGLNAAEQITRKLPSVKLVFISVNTSAEVAAEAFRRGASAFVPKQAGREEFLTAVRAAMAGQYFLSSLTARETMEYLLHGAKDSNTQKITQRQTEILQLLAEGRSMKEVANVLDISPGTVAFHKYNMMEKLGIASNAELLQFAITRYMAPAARNWAVATVA